MGDIAEAEGRAANIAELLVIAEDSRGLEDANFSFLVCGACTELQLEPTIVADELRVSTSLLDHWRRATSLPHMSTRKVVVAHLRSLLDRKLDELREKIDADELRDASRASIYG